jgi:hypothetical protein
MRAALAACVVVALLAAGAAPAAAQLPSTIQALLEKPELRPFINKVLGIRACLSDPSLPKFDVQQCGGLLRLLDAVNLGNTNPAMSCEESCVEQFGKLSEACSKDLRDAFEGDTTSLGQLATEFFMTCDETSNELLAAMAPTPAPEEPLPAASPATEAVVEAQPTVPSPTPVETATPSGAAALPKAMLSALALVAAAAYMLA